jgi:hypothetical protein
MVAQLLELIGKFVIAAANCVAALMVVIDMVKRRHALPAASSY